MGALAIALFIHNGQVCFVVGVVASSMVWCGDPSGWAFVNKHNRDTMVFGQAKWECLAKFVKDTFGVLVQNASDGDGSNQNRHLLLGTLCGELRT